VINEETRKYASSEDLSQPEIQKMIVRKVQRRIQPIQSGLPGIELTSGGDDIVAEVVKTVSEKIPLSLLYAVSDKLSQAC
jgi:hypothetical protein